MLDQRWHKVGMIFVGITMTSDVGPTLADDRLAYVGILLATDIVPTLDGRRQPSCWHVVGVRYCANVGL